MPIELRQSDGLSFQLAISYRLPKGTTGMAPVRLCSNEDRHPIYKARVYSGWQDSLFNYICSSFLATALSYYTFALNISQVLYSEYSVKRTEKV